MSDRSDVIYVYDGSYQGLLCCIFDSYERKEVPCGIYTVDLEPVTLFRVHQVVTEEKHSQRVSNGIYNNISPDVLEKVEIAFTSCMEDKEIKILDYVRYGFKVGSKLTQLLGEPCVDAIEKGVRSVLVEAHILKGFIRFREINGILASEITPKNIVLPFLHSHFTDRFSGERLLIIDRTHNQAMAYEKGRTKIFFFEELILPPTGEEETKIKRLWRRFYDTIAIEERINPKCQLGHMPKRFWSNMTEHQEDDDTGEADTPKVGGSIKLADHS